jgi:hypothetical protein
MPSRHRIISAFSGVCVFLLALRGRARGESKRRRDGYSPAFGRLHEDPLGDAARGRVLLRHGVAVSPVHDSGSNWQHAQIPGNESVGPSRIAARTPALVPEFQPRWSVPSQRTRVKIRGEIPRAVTFVYRVDVFVEQAPRLGRIGRARQ